MFLGRQVNHTSYAVKCVKKLGTKDKAIFEDVFVHFAASEPPQFDVRASFFGSF